MRDLNQKCIQANRPVVTITSTVYDRRALDINSDIPLINSLNHLTYLTSNSGKVRETLANDGALERLVAILQGCYIPLFELLGLDLKHVSKHKRAQSIWRQKKLAMCAWKWTLAFQCLVLTGTRGTEQIRKKVVLSGVVPVLATVVDNYLIYHKKYDHLKGGPIDINLSSLESEKTYRLLRKDENESYAQYMEYITGRDPLRLSNDDNFAGEDLMGPSMTLPSDFIEIWLNCRTSTDVDGIDGKRREKDSPSESTESETSDKFNAGDGSFVGDDDQSLCISVPRDFLLGRVIPKQDDVIWSLQLLAFISKYTYMKQQLQNVELVESLSFRSVVERVRKRLAQKERPDGEGSASGDIVMQDAPPNHMAATDDPFLIELQEVARSCKQSEKETIKENEPFFQKRYRHFISSISTEHNQPRRVQERRLIDDFKRKWDYNTLSTELDDETWSYINSKESLNLFPLVERCTVNHENPHDMVYWSSVIMRNSCRKNEVTGVRQCANFACGKWEDFPRQFAKCRRCKRTKYCSRDCQLTAWTYHRYWCHEVGTSVSTTASTTGANTPNAAHSSNSLSQNPPDDGTTINFTINNNATEDAANGGGIAVGGGIEGAEAVPAGFNVRAADSPTTLSMNDNGRPNVDNVVRHIIGDITEEEDEMVLTDQNSGSNIA
ncbi:hypothetical protein HG536_0A03850 [Torulaspora globosa]|uniref:MYND-type domain-containing protein n=1 Tax=Torulaspora globosa TaxID=48254 RepID=A0A7G3ZAN1_9SACH|nr:uncharacterized protein HG536_0A03850 [Torulaspora globosa]QLL30567.1 hypothetical protein HG536_0A03850 [Torulaspora globosa]